MKEKEIMARQLIGLMKEEVWLSVRWKDVAAKAIGVHSTDLTLLTFVYEFGPVTAGRLAVVADLTTGATTAAIDRLEKAGFVKRRADEKDGRKVMVSPTRLPVAFHEIHDSVREELFDVLSRYTSAELRSIMSSRRQVIDLLQRQIDSLKSGSA